MSKKDREVKMPHATPPKILALSPDTIKEILVLACSWSLFIAVSTGMDTVGPISMKEVGASDSLASFTFGAYLIGNAISAISSAKIFNALKRKKGFLLGGMSQLVGSILCVIAMRIKSPILVLVGALFIGFGQVGLGLSLGLVFKGILIYTFKVVVSCFKRSDVLDSSDVLPSHPLMPLASPITIILISTLFNTKQTQNSYLYICVRTYRVWAISSDSLQLKSFRRTLRPRS